MENLIEKQLLLVHRQGYMRQVIPVLITIVFFGLVAWLHVDVVCRVWASDKPTVNKANCSCSCFDTIYRGRYEYPPSGFKHIYMNATSNTFRIWLVLVVNIILFYKVIERVYKILRKAPAVRRTFLALVCVNTYPHYYSFWSYFNYYNEEVYDYFYHHLFFYVTEWLATFIVVHLIDQRAQMTVLKLVVIIDISIVHLIVSGADQLISHVVYQRAPFFINARDVSLAVCDVIHLTIAAFYLVRISSVRGVTTNAHSTHSLVYPSRAAHSGNSHASNANSGWRLDVTNFVTRYEVLASVIFILTSCVILRLF